MIQTPCYIYDEYVLSGRIRLIRSILGEGIGVCYAMKANPALAAAAAGTAAAGSSDQTGFTDALEVCSPGEYEICMRQGVAPAKLIVSGVNKSRGTLSRILDLSKGAGIYTIESMLHYHLLEELASERNLKLPVLIRLSSGNQFGVDEKTFADILEKVHASDHLVFAGVHYFSGTQKPMKKIEKELTMLAAFGRKLRGNTPLHLEYGPGLRVGYFANDSDRDRQAADPLGQLQQLADIIAQTGLRAVYDTITFEHGRFIAAPCGTYYTSAADVKETEGSTYLIIDGGIHQIQYYGSMLGMKHPYIRVMDHEAFIREAETGEKMPEAARMKPDGDMNKPYIICGSLCSINDVLARDIPLPPVQPGDVLAFERCGAYAATEGIALFLSRDLPAIWIRGEDESITCLREGMATDPWNG